MIGSLSSLKAHTQIYIVVRISYLYMSGCISIILTLKLNEFGFVLQIIEGVDGQQDVIEMLKIFALQVHKHPAI